MSTEMEWIGMEKAPDTGEPFLMAVNIEPGKTDYITISWYDDDTGHRGNEGYVFWDCVGECWRHWNQTGGWMPLPGMPNIHACNNSVKNLLDTLEFYANPPRIDEDGDPLSIPEFYGEMDFGNRAFEAIKKFTEGNQ